MSFQVNDLINENIYDIIDKLISYSAFGICIVLPGHDSHFTGERGTLNSLR